MEKINVAVGVIQYDGKILLMKRSPTKKYYPLKWENAGGSIQKLETPEEAVIREVKEETGLRCRIIRKGESVEITSYGVTFTVLPFLVSVENNNVILSKEHTEYKWVDVNDYKNFDCVDGIENDYASLGLIDRK